MSLIGSLLVAGSAAGFGSMALFAHYAYADGVNPGTLTFLRFLIGALLLGIWVWARGVRLPRGRVLAAYALMGGGLYCVAAWCYFAALQYASSGVVALMLYTYPLFVAGIATLTGNERFGRRERLAMALAALGLALALGGGGLGQPLGLALGVLAGLLYAVYLVAGSRLADRCDPFAAAFVVLASAAASNGAMVALGDGFSLPAGENGWLAVVGIGLFSSALALAALFAGMRRLGATRASVLSTVEPLITIALGCVFLGEAWTGLQWLGSLAIVAAALAITLPRKAASAA
ncbi:threonine/homoserine efflux transporter RhtA [Crenobacter luteus]|uniref:DMT family transporter n=1 Tax=Crenobacter luteus TaxID=1452487 RepID=UPI00104827DA|nr:DMT family transporter [Crenobacter luteus]TCP10252.1 threonine/homoserine efflux transporter RhtA [Crenobacter luteus]